MVLFCSQSNGSFSMYVESQFKVSYNLPGLHVCKQSVGIPAFLGVLHSAIIGRIFLAGFVGCLLGSRRRKAWQRSLLTYNICINICPLVKSSSWWWWWQYDQAKRMWKDKADWPGRFIIESFDNHLTWTSPWISSNRNLLIWALPHMYFAREPPVRAMII